VRIYQVLEFFSHTNSHTGFVYFNSNPV